ncbi:hypothetical protein I545_5738 [Mycobacterium kansasii 662]|uniref:Uncharacterized protein n=2 Tax=Mycobacterium kansasii TaxID=1768 RepID=A0A1V3X670_MYCKA|nr:hypothetical protein I547_6802 [Mycobacterium kansasii 824]EUA10248.1 hypothetical protein I545_5738 [Mycobacterium kansasii 662]OOK74557.1 hypothetical protein BZL29_4626 [Mycobacterium kansasii]
MKTSNPLDNWGGQLSDIFASNHSFACRSGARAGTGDRRRTGANMRDELDFQPAWLPGATTVR